MAFDAGSIVVYFKAQTAELVKGIQESNEHLEGFKKGLEGLGAYEVFEKIKETVFECVDAASDLELNTHKLQAAISTQTDLSTFQELAEHLSQVTTFTDDAALASLALLGKFNLTDQQMGSLLPKIADFAAFMGEDLPSAASAAGRAIANGSAGLRGLGLAFTDTEKKAFDMGSQQDRVAILLDKMTQKFGGVAAAAAATGAGGIKQYHNAVEGLAEAIGGLIESPIGTFFGLMAQVMRGLASGINNMSDTMRTIVTVTGSVAAAFTAATAATLAWGGAVKFLGGLPTILRTIAAAASTVSATMLPIAAALAGVAAAALIVQGVNVRASGGQLSADSSLSYMERIKLAFSSGLDDVKSKFGLLFDAPKESASKLDASLKELDNTARTASKDLTIDFKSELEATRGDPFEKLGSSIGIDFAKHTGADVDGYTAPDTTASDEAATNAIGDAVSSALAAPVLPQGMNAEAIQASADQLRDSISTTDLAFAGVKGGLLQLAGRMGGAAGAITGLVTKLASGDVVGAVVGVGMEMLTRTKSFGALMQSLEGIFTAVSQILDPLVKALLPFLDIISMLVPAMVALNFPLRVLGLVVETIGNVIKSFIIAVSSFWNGIVETVANLVAKIPFVGEKVAEWIREAEIMPPDAPKVSGYAGALGDATNGVKGLGDAAASTSEQLLNVPQGFKVAAARYAAIIRGEGDPGSGVSPNAGGKTLGQLVYGDSGTATPMRPGGITFPATTRPATSATVPTLNIANLNVTTNDPKQLSSAIASSAKQATFLRTGQTTSPTSAARSFWGA